VDDDKSLLEAVSKYLQEHVRARIRDVAVSTCVCMDRHELYSEQMRHVYMSEVWPLMCIGVPYARGGEHDPGD
jgi:hypothetical protein